MIAFLIWAVIALVGVVSTVFFKSFVAYRISNSVLRIITISFLRMKIDSEELASCFGFVWGYAALVLGNMFPTTTCSIDDDDSFTMQPYGMAFTSSQGYNLVFYRNRSFWFNQKLGEIQLECIGIEVISATITAGHNNVNRLVIKADNATAVDTMLSFDRPFDFKHSIAYQP